MILFFHFNTKIRGKETGDKGANTAEIQWQRGELFSSSKNLFQTWEGNLGKTQEKIGNSSGQHFVKILKFNLRLKSRLKPKCKKTFNSRNFTKTTAMGLSIKVHTHLPSTWG